MASHVLLDEQWGQGMKYMLALFEEEMLLAKPKDDGKNKRKKDKTPVSNGLVEWSFLYFKYLQVYTKLEDCYDQIVHPQKRRDAKKALEACIGRILEIKSFMVILHEGGEYYDFSDHLVNRKLSFEVLNVIPPRFLTDDNKALLESREKFLIAALTKHGLMNVPEPTKPPSVLTLDEAAIVIQAEERGRQARQKDHRDPENSDYRAMQEVELARQKAGVESHTRESACLVIQRVIRGFLGRVRTRKAALEELTFIGMNNFQPPDPEDPRKKLVEINDRRKKGQLENELELQNATCATLQKIKDLEGQEMCEIIQERVNVYLNENREPETGMYQGLPKKKDGGSYLIVDPLPPIERPVSDKDKEKRGDDQQQKKRKKTKGGQVPPPKFPEPDEDAPPTCPDYFRRFVKGSHDLYKKNWFDKDDYGNFEQKFVPDLLKSALRPIVFEEMRLLTDDNTKKLLINLKKKMKIEKKARIKALLKQAKKEGKEKEFKARLKAERAQEKKDRIARKKAKKEAEKEKKEDAAPPPPKKPKRKKDTSMNKSLDIIFDELVKNGIIQLCPQRSFSEYVGAENYTAVPQMPGWAARVDPSMAQAKRQVIEYCILPLATEMVNSKAPLIKSVLLYGGEGVGKTLLVHATCRSAGCTFFNLSPRNTNGKFQGGKKVVQMIQMTFKMAKIMAPSIIYIDEVEKVFINARKKIKSWGMKDKPNRIKRALNKEMKAVWPGDRVVVIGCTSRPQDCGGKKGPNKLTSTFLNFFTKRIYCPYPDYASRLMIWRILLERHKAQLKYGFDVSILASYSKNFSVSSIEQVIKWACTEKRIRCIKRVTLHPHELLNHCYKIQPWDVETHTRVRDYGKPPPPEEEPVKGQRGKKPPPKPAKGK